MGVKDGLASTGIIVKIAFVVVLISMFCNWLAFTTTSWYRNDSEVYLGLWRSCVPSTLYRCYPTDGSSDTKYGVVQAFGIVGFLSQNVGFLLIILYMFQGKCRGNSEVRLASAILLIVSAIGWLIAVAIFGAIYTEKAEYLHYSYALAVCACGLGLFGGILMFVGGGGQRLVVGQVVSS